MGCVWRATQLSLQRAVAIKFLYNFGPHLERQAERFLREARIAAAIAHRNVVDIVDFGVEEQQPYMVMSLLNGVTLGDRLDKGGAMSVRELTRIVAMSLRGLAAVHEAGIVHRDLKPENIFLVSDPEGAYPKLLDFGISRFLSASPTRRSAMTTREGIMVGTPQYMAPEQARGLRDIDMRADLYSMGVILYEALTGQLPYDSENIGDLIIMIVRGGAPSVFERRPEAGRAVSDVVARALHVEPQARFATALEMQNALLDAVEHTTGSPVTQSLSTLPRPIRSALPSNIRFSKPAPRMINARREQPGTLPVGALPVGALPVGGLPTGARPQTRRPLFKPPAPSAAEMPQDEAIPKLPAPPLTPKAADLDRAGRTRISTPGHPTLEVEPLPDLPWPAPRSPQPPPIPKHVPRNSQHTPRHTLARAWTFARQRLHWRAREGAQMLRQLSSRTLSVCQTRLERLPRRLRQPAVAWGAATLLMILVGWWLRPVPTHSATAGTVEAAPAITETATSASSWPASSNGQSAEAETPLHVNIGNTGLRSVLDEDEDVESDEVGDTAARSSVDVAQHTRATADADTSPQEAAATAEAEVSASPQEVVPVVKARPRPLAAKKKKPRRKATARRTNRTRGSTTLLRRLDY